MTTIALARILAHVSSIPFTEPRTHPGADAAPSLCPRAAPSPAPCRTLATGFRARNRAATVGRSTPLCGADWVAKALESSCVCVAGHWGDWDSKTTSEREYFQKLNSRHSK